MTSAWGEAFREPHPPASARASYSFRQDVERRADSGSCLARQQSSLGYWFRARLFAGGPWLGGDYVGSPASSFVIAWRMAAKASSINQFLIIYRVLHPASNIITTQTVQGSQEYLRIKRRWYAPALPSAELEAGALRIKMGCAKWQPLGFSG